jgi:hypothetical protein
MIIRVNDKNINAKNILGETMRQNGKSYPALRVVFDGGVTADELNALCSGALEILDDAGNVVGTQDGYTTLGEHSVVIGKITTAEQERDTLAAALAVETAKAPYIETLTAGLDDAVASTVIPLYPKMRYDGSLIPAGTRINWNGVLKRAAVDVWDFEHNDPDHAPTRWEDISYRDGYRIIPDVITVGLAFSAGERGWWGNILMESIPDNNVYTPEEYAANWREVTE